MRCLPGRLTVCFTALLFVVLPVLAHEGVVLDAGGKPIAGATVCLLVPSTDTEGFCGLTDESGRYRLPGNSIVRVRVSAEGFYPQTIPSKDRLKPVRLTRAASILVHVLDAEGRPIPDASVYVLTPDGRNRGRGYTNTAGVRIGPLPVGDLIIKATADGFLSKKSPIVPLVAGEETTIELRLEQDPDQS